MPKGSFIVVDFGLFCEIARTLALQGAEKVGFFSDFASAFPSQYQLQVGAGFQNVVRINDFYPLIGQGYTWIMPDILHGGLAVHLEGLGENVWSAKYAEDVELFRIECKELFEQLKIPVPKWDVVVGITALREYLKTHENVFIKISLIRGMSETWKSENLKFSEGILDRLARDLGPWREKQEFLCEAEVPDAVEISYDLYSVDGEYPQKTVFGVEIKSEAWFARTMIYDQLPPQVRDYNAKIAPTLKEYRCRSNTPCELRVEKNGDYKAIDVCMREGSPSSEAKLNLISNWPKIYGDGGQRHTD